MDAPIVAQESPEASTPNCPSRDLAPSRPPAELVPATRRACVRHLQCKDVSARRGGFRSADCGRMPPVGIQEEPGLRRDSITLSEGVARPRGSYSHAVTAGDFVFVSGQGAMNAATGRYVEGGIKEQTVQTLKNIRTILTGLGLQMSDVVKVCVFLKDGHDLEDFNSAYAKFFERGSPARTAVQAVLPDERMLVEIEAIATVSRGKGKTGMGRRRSG